VPPTVKKILNVLGTLLVLAVALLFAYLKWWNVVGQDKLNGSCNSSAGCRSYWCLKHELDGPAERPSSGYCTDKCSEDSDCTTGMSCVVPSAEALDDLAKAMRPKKLCERVHAAAH
jgi:hypothetical protein